MILDYILKFHLQDCLNILSESDNLGYFSIKIDFLKLFETYPDVGDKVLCSPIESLPLCHRDIVKAQKIILENNEYKEILMKLSYFYLKNNVFARFFGLPVCPELHRTVFPKNIDLGCFLKVTGTVVRVTQSKMLEYQRKYVCVKCKFENCVEADFENRYILKTPTKCGNDNPKCRCSTFTQVNLVSREHCRDYQEIKIQEQVNKLSVGTIPGSLWVVLEDDLVDCCKPGDDVIICGTVRRRWRPSVQNRKSEVELVLQANYIEVCNAQRSEVIATAPDVKECFNEYWAKYESCPLKGRDHILKSVCPQVYGLHVVKLAVLLTVITGSNNNQEERDKTSCYDDKHSTRVRGQCHLLLVGDPGTGKSQLLRASAELTVRSVFTTGAGSTRAGLTCAALREEGEWQLEAGALVLSDGGVCCIDEISQLREHDRTAIHEAMEQQTISIAKAGIVCKLNTRCAIIAACNPKGHYDTDQSLSVNVSLGTPLLSRFDLIFILLDSKNKSWDKLVSSYILFGGSNLQESKKLWSLEKLQMYISLVGPRGTKMTKSANVILQSYYMTQRKSACRDASRTTVRMLDSLVRLSQAHCRLMYRNVILPMDAIIAVSLVDLSMQDCTLSDTVDALHSTFQNYPDFEYLCMAKKLLFKLNLDEIWYNELLYYGKLLQVDHKTLENDIDKGITRLFAKCDDISDDNIHLSSSLVTSSYFNKYKHTDDNSLGIDSEKEKAQKPDTIPDLSERGSSVNKNLASTLKKHANLNKCEKNPVVTQKKGKKKRKEITINSTTIRTKMAKRSKKSSPQNGNNNISDSEEINGANILNAVPSVNDAFMDLGVGFKFENSLCDELTINNYDKINNRDENICIKEEPNETSDTFNNSYSTEINNKNKCENVKEKSSSSEVKKKDVNTSKTANKLKQFQFEEKHDFKKYDEIPQVPVVKCQVSNVKSQHHNDLKTNPTICQKSAQSSQISIFEGSDCEIDLDI